MEWLIVILLGLLVGYIGGYAGIGGAPFMIAFLVLVMGIPQHTAQGTVLTMMLGPMSLMAVYSLRHETKLQWKNILIGIGTYAFFSYFGALWAFDLPEKQLKRIFAAMLIVIALFQIFYNSKEKNSNEHIPWYWMAIIGSLAGVVGGFFGIGAGVLFIPVFISLFGLKKNFARALSLGILLPPVSLGAFIKYYQMDAIRWDYVVILFTGYFIANYFGAKKGSRASLKTFKTVYSLILLLLAGLYFIN
jgi:uncharacterized membrane protein YfcA